MTKFVIALTIVIDGFFTVQLFAQDNPKIENMIVVLETSTPANAVAMLGKFLDLINGSDWNKLTPNQRDRLVQAFIYQLKKGRMVSEKGESEEAFKYLELLGKIGGRLKDPRTIPVLVEGVGTGYFGNALAKIGAPAIEPLLKKYDSADINEKDIILYVFQKMGASEIKDKRKKVIACILRGSKDTEAFIRGKAIKTLSELGDANVIPALEEIEKNDPEIYEVDTSSGSWKGYGKYKRYIVREEASEALKKIKARLKNKSQELSPGTTQQNKTQ
jgi:hypothetical protein